LNRINEESYEMPVSVTMPRLGESVTEGTVTRWLKQEGERVEADEPLLEVSTDKVDTEIPSPAAGVLTRIVVHEDETAEVGSELAVIGGDSDPGGAAHAADSGSADAPDVRVSDEEAEQSPDEQLAAAAATEPSTERPADSEAPAAPAAGSDPSSGGGATTTVTMPALGESVTEGTVTRWLKNVGDPVEADEPLLEVSTDKVDTEIPAPAAGTLLEIKVGQDETVPVGADLAVIGAAGSGGGQPAAAPEKPAAAEQPAEPAAPTQPTAAETPPPSQPAQRQPAQSQAAQRQPAQSQAAQSQPAQSQAAQSQAAQSQPTQSQPAQSQPTQSQAAQSQPAQSQAAAPGRPSPEDTAGDNGGTEDVGYVTPLVRKLAAEHSVDLSALHGTGVGGRIRKQDVLDEADRQKVAKAAAEAEARAPKSSPAAAPAPKTEPSPLRGQTVKLPRLRALIARRMVESLQISAQLTTVVEVDVTRIARLRDAAKADFVRREGAKLSFLPFFALATVEALRVHPSLNASLDLEAGTVTYHGAEHLGIAVDTERGLVVPVIHNAGDLNLAGLARRIADVAERTRTNKIMPDEIGGGTFTLTNTGSRGALFDTPIINQPQVGILGTGAVVKRAVVVEDADLGEIFVPRSMVYLALSYDHRLVDGADAARFLGTIKERLEAGNFESELAL
jgi:2-oxoglutarate dehydrogenase E2 component (dihydrolipoamide succinyltransferase)